MKNIHSLLEQEAAMKAVIEKAMGELRKSVAKEIANNPAEGVKAIGNGDGPHIAVVQFSAIRRENNMSAETFIPSSQADAVERKLASCSTLQGMLNVLQKMVAERKVTFGGKDKETVRLNSKTVEILSQVIADTNNKEEK